MCSLARRGLLVPKQRLVEQQGHDGGGPVAFQQAFGTQQLLLGAGPQRGVKIFQDVPHYILHLLGRGEEPVTLTAFLPLPAPITALTQGTLVSHMEVLGYHMQISRGHKMISQSYCQVGSNTCHLRPEVQEEDMNDSEDTSPFRKEDHSVQPCQGISLYYCIS